MEENLEKKVNTQKDIVGAFDLSLRRNNKQIRDDRAQAISRNARLKYKRLIEDLREELTNIEDEVENSLDMSPTNAQSLVLATDFDAESYAKKDLEVGVKIRNLKIKIEVAVDRFKHLFGEDI